ncbi:hypothetical protein RchiOBHm_Chr3g0496491 [Rosa chinensis]|uniref:Uncharacterized protein n=1 Tax=Rosa chinensis TaxID=74649 RepID=A0A2P6RHH6_ROSCH|nr:hypothetical protein RchiOBHm_Chr3g0496491 [Rosa chinensis]
MPPATEEPNTTASSTMMMIDEIYEFSAPRFFDFIKDENEDDKINAELWFDSPSRTIPYPSSLFFILQFVNSLLRFFSDLFLCWIPFSLQIRDLGFLLFNSIT